MDEKTNGGGGRHSGDPEDTDGTTDDHGPTTIEADLDGTLTFRLRIPDDWMITPTEPNEFRAWLSQELAGFEGVDREELAQIQSTLGTRMVEANSLGLVASAVYADVIRDDASAKLITAVLAVTMQTLPSDEPVLSIPTLLMTLASLESTDDIRLLEEPQVLEMGNFEAVRTVGIEDEGGHGDDVYVANITVAYRAPLADGRTLLTVALATPCYWLSDELVPLFDAIAHTTELVLPPELAEMAERVADQV